MFQSRKYYPQGTISTANYVVSKTAWVFLGISRPNLFVFLLLGFALPARKFSSTCVWSSVQTDTCNATTSSIWQSWPFSTSQSDSCWLRWKLISLTVHKYKYFQFIWMSWDQVLVIFLFDLFQNTNKVFNFLQDGKQRIHFMHRMTHFCCLFITCQPNDLRKKKLNISKANCKTFRSENLKPKWYMTCKDRGLKP